jgi:cytochrome c
MSAWWLAALLSAGPLDAGVARVGDASKGPAIYARCLACHDLQRDRTGPHHCGLNGRRAGTVPGFEYSEAMKRSGLTWSKETLDRFLAAPMEAVPGTLMAWAGVPDAQERADLIAWLLQQRCAQ